MKMSLSNTDGNGAKEKVTLHFGPGHKAERVEMEEFKLRAAVEYDARQILAAREERQI